MTSVINRSFMTLARKGVSRKTSSAALRSTCSHGTPSPLFFFLGASRFGRVFFFSSAIVSIHLILTSHSRRPALSGQGGNEGEYGNRCKGFGGLRVLGCSDL